MKLFLSGGGSGEQSKELDELFAKQLDKSKPLLYIPIAIDKKKHPYKECLKWLKGTFNQLGVKNYRLLDEEHLVDYNKVNLYDFSGIYIGGGNTSYLLKTLKELNFWNVLKRALKESLPIYGGSAGAIIFAKTITPSLNDDENFVKLTDFSGMDTLKGKDIFCHYSTLKEGNVKDIIKKYNLNKIIALSEETGLQISDDKIKVIGKKSAFLFFNNHKEELKSGSLIPLNL